MNDLLPKSISDDDSACGWSFTLYFLGECARAYPEPISFDRAALLLARMDVELIQSGLIMRPYERFRMRSGVLQLWSLDQFIKGHWSPFHRLLRVEDDRFFLNPGFESMLESTNYSDPNALLGSTCGLSDDIMEANLESWLSESNESLYKSISDYMGHPVQEWQSYGDLIPAMPGPDEILRQHLSESWSDRVAIDVAFKNI